MLAKSRCRLANPLEDKGQNLECRLEKDAEEQVIA
jgi:hypothetical protein